MSFLQVNHNDAGSNQNKGEFPTIDEGTYEGIIKEVEVTQSKSGNDMIKVTVVIRDDVKQQFAKRKVWDYLVVTEKTKWKLNQVAKAIGMADGAKVATIQEFAKSILWAAVKVKIKHEQDTYQGETKTRERIDRYEQTDFPRESVADSDMPFATPAASKGSSTIPF
ncbi:Protein of unknown function DUF669 [uncultured Caudovirales phage]|uniref:DUF669 domain-containing protein n=1 Tax=uncultured Caudovirales phage TaxID=2100421 RepID=A0A6J5M8J0_9CAUD|nr:Protein of unknown function DUF669 [uncultured Caudovirales phage]